MHSLPRRTLFLLFFLSGFSSLVYQVVWTRMAFAAFGIITPVLSVVLSIFMLGLAIGSWAGGRWVERWASARGVSAALFYGVAELLVGAGAFAVPELFAASSHVLLPAGAMDSGTYLFLSALALAISIFPWCVCMGSTFPLMMAYVREVEPDNTRSFSFLYVANVLGAMTGTFCTAFVLVEMLGFHRTLEVGAAGNCFIAVVAGALGSVQKKDPVLREGSGAVHIPAVATGVATGASTGLVKWILFSTGLISMAMEVVWSRAFTIVLKTQVYSFASIVFTYLGATFFGSLMYRWHLRKKRVASLSGLLYMLGMAAFLPVLLNDPRVALQSPGYVFNFGAIVIVLASICPLCALMGYLTPKLIDSYSAGRPRDAGDAYAINILGCILGPLIAAYLLLPWMSERWALVLLGLPLAGFWLAVSRRQAGRWRIAFVVPMALIATWAMFFSMDFEAMAARFYPEAVVRRDYVASVISFGRQREKKTLLVNGFGMTALTPATKFIAHLALAMHRGKPSSALVICFGMGTTYRSALTWDIDTTAVELVPSVVQAFGFYHADAGVCLSDANGHVVIDDGRRYLQRCGRKFDVIMVDPPPPVEAAGCSLLFSEEFYALAKRHLNPGGIVEMWDPLDSGLMNDAIEHSIFESFPFTRVYRSVTGLGLHLFGSMNPIDQLSPDTMAERMPAAAKADLLEWADTRDLRAYLGRVLSQEEPIEPGRNSLLKITDDRPINEYFILRLLTGGSALPAYEGH